MFGVTYTSAFLAGILTFLAPCTLPLVPAYLAFIASGDHTAEGHGPFKRALAFVGGFAAVVIAVGVFVSGFGRYLVAHRLVMSICGGVLFVLFGLVLLEVIKLPARSSSMPKWLHPTGYLSVGLMGVVFAFGWSPCVGPILGSIYVLAAQSGTAGQGAILLTCYALGHSIPFLLLAYFYDRAFKIVTSLAKYATQISRTAGVLLVIIGLIMVSGQYPVLLEWFGKFLNGGWQERLMNYL